MHITKGGSAPLKPPFGGGTCSGVPPPYWWIWIIWNHEEKDFGVFNASIIKLDMELTNGDFKEQNYIEYYWFKVL